MLARQNEGGMTDLSRLIELFSELHVTTPSKRHYLRGRVDEHIAQNAISAEDVAEARARAVVSIDPAALREALGPASDSTRED